MRVSSCDRETVCYCCPGDAANKSRAAPLDVAMNNKWARIVHTPGAVVCVNPRQDAYIQTHFLELA